MCGILAVFGIRAGGGSERYRGDVIRLSKQIRHRGPDWNGIHCFGDCILAHERLAVVGLHSGAQPIVTKNGNAALSVNGEIYNHEELERDLKRENPELAAEWSTDSDCEVLLHLFKKYGPSFLERNEVNGMYAFIAFNQETDEYMVARDPVGIIPLYQGWGSDGTVWFASEMKALQSVCDHMEVFPPGHYYTATAGGTISKGVTRPFYQERWSKEIGFMPNGSAADLRTELTDSVRRHIMSEVPYGLLLSGGLDSSLIAAIACREYKRLGNADALRSFCIGLEGSPDIKAAEMVANHIGTRHYSFTFTVQQGIDVLSDVIHHLETFDVTTIRASTPMFLLARRVKATGCKMVLSGEGADEIFGGYLYFHKAPDATEFQKEIVTKVTSLHKFDCLRANKSTMAWGVEARVPFLDRRFLEYAMNMDPELKMCRGSKIEKHVLREAFDDKDDPYIPDSVLWRQKEQFSDGVGYGWIDGLRDYAEEKVTDIQLKFAANRFRESPPETKEAYLYRDIFSNLFPSPSAAETVPYGKSIACSSPAALAWDAAFQNAADPSGRSIAGVHVSANC